MITNAQSARLYFAYMLELKKQIWLEYEIMTKRIFKEQSSISNYLNQIKSIESHDDWWPSFVSLVKSILGKQFDLLSINELDISGQKYKLLGNLMFNYSRNIHWSHKIIRESFFAQLIAANTNTPNVKSFYIATDGFKFHVYEIVDINTTNKFTMQIIYGLNLSSPMTTEQTALRDITHLLSHIE